MVNLCDKKFSQAVGVIYNNIDKPITLDEIANRLQVSVATLKRIFREAIEQSPGAFIRRLRMELAFRSLKSYENSILEVALASGFEDQSAFTRQFKKTFGYVPTMARKKMNIINEFECVVLEEPDIVELSDIEIQATTKIGLYFESAPKAWQKLKEKLTKTELSDDFSGIFVGIGHDNPHQGDISDDQVRYSAGVSHLTRDLNAECINIVGGQYARFRFQGKPNNLGLAYHYIFGQWAENSSFTINGRKSVFHTFDNFPEALKEQKIMIHAPLIY